MIGSKLLDGFHAMYDLDVAHISEIERKLDALLSGMV